MSRNQPDTDCYELAFQAGYPIDEPGEVALEDYARALTQARGAEAARARDDPAMVQGVHVCGLGSPLSRSIMTDIEDFARGLARPGGGGLGWS